ncbi:hypothetical protein CRG98_006838 [Punica granatum]|uniref:Uncharacterized protein n=1 Tax=Punica granatum TaxID=22663 RepID=A0A2I0KWM8_PUNGR|nr:hypothetical protein CRG98_006838 [Punica granatum]
MPSPSLRAFSISAKKVVDSLSAEMEKARKEGEGIGLAKFLKSTELKEMVKFALQEGSTDLKNSPEMPSLNPTRLNYIKLLISQSLVSPRPTSRIDEARLGPHHGPRLSVCSSTPEVRAALGRLTDFKMSVMALYLVNEPSLIFVFASPLSIEAQPDFSSVDFKNLARPMPSPSLRAFSISAKKVVDSLSAEMEKARKEGEGIGLAKFLKSTELKEMVKFALQEGSTDLKNSPEMPSLNPTRLNYIKLLISQSLVSPRPTSRIDEARLGPHHGPRLSVCSSTPEVRAALGRLTDFKMSVMALYLVNEPSLIFVFASPLSIEAQPDFSSVDFKNLARPMPSPSLRAFSISAKKVVDSLSAEMEKARKEGEGIGLAKFLKSTELKEMVKFALQEGSTDLKNSPEMPSLNPTRLNYIKLLISQSLVSPRPTSRIDEARLGPHHGPRLSVCSSTPEVRAALGRLTDFKMSVMALYLVNEPSLIFVFASPLSIEAQPDFSSVDFKNLARPMPSPSLRAFSISAKKVVDSLSAEMEKARKEGEGIGLAKFLKSTELKEMVKFALQEGSTDLKNSPEYERLVFPED